MDKSALEAKKAGLENQFNNLQTQKDDITKQMYQVQGAHAAVSELLDNFKEEPKDGADKPRSAKKSAK